MISVIIPTYNRAAFISDAIQSVLRQTNKDFELIVVDDGSTDNSCDVIRPYADRITYIYQQNAGIAAARNAGIEHSKGKYVTFLDSDDIWLPTKLEKQVSFFKQHLDIGMVYADYGMFSEEGIIDSSHSSRKNLNISHRSGYVFEELLMNCHIHTITVMVKREVLADVGLFDVNFATGEDYDLWLRIAAKYKVAYLPELVAMHRDHSLNITTTRLIAERPGEIQAVENALAMFPDKIKGIPSHRVNLRISNTYLQTGFSAYKERKFSVARFHFRKCLSLQPFNLKALCYVALSSFLPHLAYSLIYITIQKLKHSLTKKTFPFSL